MVDGKERIELWVSVVNKGQVGRLSGWRDVNDSQGLRRPRAYQWGSQTWVVIGKNTPCGSHPQGGEDSEASEGPEQLGESVGGAPPRPPL